MTVKSNNNIQAIKEGLTIDQIDSYLCNALGSNGFKTDNNGSHIYQTVCHGGDSYKLYYFLDSKMFYCFTHCNETFDIFELTQRAKHFTTFGQAYKYLCNFFNIEGRSGDWQEEEVELTDDWGILNKFFDFEQAEKREREEREKKLAVIPENILEMYSSGQYPDAWLKDGISAEAMEAYNIRMDLGNQKVIIPHYNDEGELIGIRGRAFNPYEIENFGKYAPICIEKQWYNHELSKNLYGLNVVKENLHRIGKVCVAESEKACMQSYTMFGENNFTVATCGSSGLSSTQINLLLKHGVKEVILAYDKEFLDGNEDMKKKYEEKLVRLTQPISTLFDVSYIFDDEGLLGYKDSPFDKGKEVLLRLMKTKRLVRPLAKEPMRNDNKRKR